MHSSSRSENLLTTNDPLCRRPAASPNGALDTELVAIWSAFVNCRARLRTLLPFLTRQIQQRGRVIDLAAGIGCEAAALARLGFRVTANEINPELQRVARRRAHEPCDIRWMQSDWREVSTALAGAQFDALLLLGNSFCLLADEGGRTQALRQFRALCKQDGAFIVDVRNFAYILDARTAILEGRFRYGRRVMYCGRRMSGRPIAISSSLVTFGYFDETGQERGRLDMTPLLLDDLLAAGTRAGFRDAMVFSDLKPGIDDAADFFTCVFR